ncbi:MAG: CinA family protein [Candidatus Izemoplasmatales bacterium]
MKDEIRLKAERLVRLLRARDQRVATAESCTGGLVAGAITAVPGASDVFGEGYVTYSDEVKARVLGVLPETLANHGSVSGECAGEMARNLEKLTHCDLALAITGYAGPTGGTDASPIGTVWFGVSRVGRTETFVERFEGTRDEIRERAVLRILLHGLEALRKQP